MSLPLTKVIMVLNVCGVGPYCQVEKVFNTVVTWLIVWINS